MITNSDSNLNNRLHHQKLNTVPNLNPNLKYRLPPTGLKQSHVRLNILYFQFNLFAKWTNNDLEFQVKWMAGDVTWEVLSSCKELEALDTVGNKTVQMFGSFGLCIEYIFLLNG